MTTEENVPFSELTTFKVGGSARYVMRGRGEDDIRQAKEFADARGLPFLVLGGGSNILPDDGISDAVFYAPQESGVESHDTSDGAVCIVGASESWDGVVSVTVQRGLFGLENLSGIPGSVGGAAVQNIGAYGAALSNTVMWVEAYDLTKKKIETFTRAQCVYGYRNSRFKAEPYRFVLMRVAFLLTRKGTVDISYTDLSERFKDTTPSSGEVRQAVLAIRAQKFPDLSVEGTAGSFFKNPIITQEEAVALKEKFPEVPLYSVPEEAGVKVPLAWFLDKVLSLRGYAQGSVRCFEKQPLVLVASRKAQAKDVRALASYIQQRIQTEIGLTIAPEVCVLNKNTLTDAITF